jgi:uncharacterized protein (DUF2252 family)
MASADPVSRIAAFNRERAPGLLALKYRKMAASPFAYFRGVNHLFHEDWPKRSFLSQQPSVWLNGDLHVENFGTYRADNRLVYFDIGDFDDCCLGPPSRDLMRFLVGLHLIWPHRAQLARDLGRAFLASYRWTLASGKARWIERRTAGGLIGNLLHELERRKQSDLLAKRTVIKRGKRKLRLDNGKALPLPEDEADQVSRFVRRYAKDRAIPEFFEVQDVAWRVAGLGTLGLPRYVVLIKGDGGANGAALVDFKIQLGSTLAPLTGILQPKFASEAERVVKIETLMQVVGPAFLTPARIAGQQFTFRELQPSADKLDIAKASPSALEMADIVRSMGELTASAQLRASGRLGAAAADDLMAFARDKSWTRPMTALAAQWSRSIATEWLDFARSDLAKAAMKARGFNSTLVAG